MVYFIRSTDFENFKIINQDTNSFNSFTLTKYILYGYQKVNKYRKVFANCNTFANLFNELAQFKQLRFSIFNVVFINP